MLELVSVYQTTTRISPYVNTNPGHREQPFPSAHGGTLILVMVLQGEREKQERKDCFVAGREVQRDKL